MITKLMAISEHHLRFEGLPAIARAFSVIVEGLGIVAAPADAPHSGQRGNRASASSQMAVRPPPEPGSRDPWPHNRRHGGGSVASPSCAPSAAGCSRSSSTSTRASSPRRPHGPPRSTRSSPPPPTRWTRRRASTLDERTALRADVERVREVLQGSDVALERHARARGLRGGPVGPAGDRPAPPPDRVARRARRPSVRRAADPQAGRRGLPGASCWSTARPRGSSLGEGRRGWRRSTTSRVDTHGQHDQGGWSQARFQRSVEQEKLNHLGEALDTLFPALQAPPVRPPGGRCARRTRRGRSSSCMHPYLRDRARLPPPTSTWRTPPRPRRSRRRPPRSSTRTWPR